MPAGASGQSDARRAALQCASKVEHDLFPLDIACERSIAVRAQREARGGLRRGSIRSVRQWDGRVPSDDLTETCDAA